MTADPHAARLNMVEGQVRTSDVTDIRILEAMRRLPRESLCPPGKVHLAYADAVVEYAPGRYLLKPRDVSRLLQALSPEPGQRALAIAAPYAALVLQALGLTVERLDEGDLGSPPATGAYDLVVSEGAVTRAPEAWLAALAMHGKLGVVERAGPMGRAMIYQRSQDGISGRPVFDSGQPLLAGFEQPAGFAF
jgi:protein-L-isoaspartate(D-aspartate) O-methyltransferase